MLPQFFTSLINLGLSIAAIVFMALLIQNNASVDLQHLAQGTEILEIQLLAAESGVAPALACTDALAAKNSTLRTCLDAGNAECSNLTLNFVAIQDNLTTLTVNSLQQRLDTLVANCSSQIATLRTLIASTAPDTNLPVLLQNGSATVTVEGAAPFSASWQQFRFSVGGFSMDYLTLLPWSSSVNTGTSNPSIVYTGIPHLQEVGSRFLLAHQASSKFTGYEISSSQLRFYTLGSGSFNLDQRLVIV